MTENITSPATYSEEAEQQVLGSLLLAPEVLFKILGMLKSDDFGMPIHGRIFAKIQEFSERGHLVSPISLRPFFEFDGDLGHLGGGNYLADLVAAVVSPQLIGDYATLIRTYAQRRSLIELGGSIIHKARDPEVALLAQLNDITLHLEKLSCEKINAISENLVVREVLSDLERGDQFDSSDLKALDQSMGGGLHLGFTYGIAAQAKVGKTMLAHSISFNLSHKEVKHAYIACEMGRKQIVQRHLARKGNFNSLEFVGHDQGEVKSWLQSEEGELPDYCLYYDNPTLTLTELKSVSLELVKRHGIRGFFLDYWQLVAGQEKNQTHEAHLSTVAQWVASFCREHGIWCILIAQLNKTGGAFASAGINRACDQYYTLHRSDLPGREDYAWLELEQSRYTPPGMVGNESAPSLIRVMSSGPYFEDFLDNRNIRYG